MFRPTVLRANVRVPMLTAIAILAVACGGHPEQAQLQQFFRASALSDGPTLSSFALVTFDAKTAGQVTSFDIVSVSEPRIEPLKIKELVQAVADAQKAESEYTDRMRTYQQEHRDAIERNAKAEAAKKKVAGADAAVQAEWAKMHAEQGTAFKKISDAREQLSATRPLAEMSLSIPNGPAPNLSQADGQMESKDVTVAATIKMPDGSTAKKNLVVTMQRAVLKGTPGKTGRWIFTAVKAA